MKDPSAREANPPTSDLDDPMDAAARLAHVERIYGHRFTEAEAAAKDPMWREIARHLQRWVASDGKVLEIACDRGYFIRNIKAGEKWASDMRDVAEHLPANVHFVRGNGLKLDEQLPNAYFDVIFMSNYLEHLASGEMVALQLRVCHDLLTPSGRLIVLQPNVRLLGGTYWDFLDHRVALTERSLSEAAGMAGLRTVRLITRYLPFTTKSRFPRHPLLVRAYLSFPPAWLILGKQTLFIGERPLTP